MRSQSNFARATAYAEINGAVGNLIDHHVENDPTINAYMIARSAILTIEALQGSPRAAQVAYRLADAMATGSSR